MTKAQEYVIQDIKKGGVWTGNYGEFQSYALAVRGIGEPVKLNLSVLSDPPKVGETVYGSLREEKSKDGRLYWLLQPEARPETDKRQLDIHAQFAIRIATDIWIAQGCDGQAYENIESEAKHFYNMIERVKQ